ncbi:hypothetical protein [Flagellimonas sp. S3867]|uniref:hypothetical protein n=1 Tax=Flagellimonas sp. S3867 TaxID=2768063 RepID=UPI0016898AEA|nr:hypothetical protein [Flagellimonas sp. S3867]
MMKNIFKVLILIVFLIFLFLSSSNTRSQLYQLTQYLFADNPYVNVDDKLAGIIRNYYSENWGKYQIHFLDNANYNFDNQGKNTDEDEVIYRLMNFYGNELALESELYRPSSKSLIEEYGLLLDDVEDDEYDFYDEIKEEYDGNVIPTVDGVAGMSDTNPPYRSSEVFWKDLAEDVFDKISISKAKIVVSSGEYPVDILLSHRYLRLDFVRDWFSANLVDDVFYSDDNKTKSKYFGPKGRLRLVPSQFWIRYNDRVFINIPSEQSETILNSISDPQLILTFNGTTQNYTISKIKPSSNSDIEGFNLMGIINESESYIYALVSERRVYPFNNKYSLPWKN